MFKHAHPHFVTGQFKPQNVFLESREYGLALDCLVKACTDLLIVDSDGPSCRVLLGKRIVEPQPDWWFMGGRMKPGETPEQSISRLVGRELRIRVDPSRFQVVGWHSYAWARRQQPPVDNGTCDVSVVFSLVIQPDEVLRIHMDENEYSEFRWFTLQEIIKEERFHPALKSSARDILTRHAWNTLRELVTSNSSNEAELANAARKLVALSDENLEYQ